MANILLLIVIYIGFISLGLPDSLLGTAWPTMRLSLNLPLEAAGAFTSITTLFTALSSFVSGHLLSRLGTGRVTFFSCLLTGSMLVGYSLAPSYIWMLLLTIPFGFGAGAVDTGLNNYVAQNYSARHMNWLHCFWGFGASVGPIIMTFSISQLNSWRMGYRIIGITQLSLSLLLLLSLPLWKEKKDKPEVVAHPKINKKNILHHKGIWMSILAFPLYIGVEAGIGLWLGSLLVEGRGLDVTTAGLWVSVFYGSIMAGRLISGFVTNRMSNRTMIRMGLLVAMAGAALILLPIRPLTLTGIILAGLGCAPVFPCMVHETPQRFGHEVSEVITGYQVGTAYLSGMAIVPMIGVLAGWISLEIIPVCVLLFGIMTLIMTERLNKIS